MEKPIKMDDLGGKPTIFGNTQLVISWFFGALAFASQKTDCGRSLTLGAAALSGAAEAETEGNRGTPFWEGEVWEVPQEMEVYLAEICHLNYKRPRETMDNIILPL